MIRLIENPVIIKEFRIRTRNWRFMVFPCLSVVYATLLWYCSFVLLSGYYRSGLSPTSSFFGSIFTPVAVFFMGLLLYCKFLISIVMPALLGASIAREREGRTLDMILLSGVHPLDIFIGKLISASSPIWLSILAMFPLVILAGGNPGVFFRNWMFPLHGINMVIYCMIIILTVMTISAFSNKVVIAVVLSYAVTLVGYPILSNAITITLSTVWSRYSGTQMAYVTNSSNLFALFSSVSGNMQVGIIIDSITSVICLTLAAALAYTAVRSLSNFVEA